MKSIGIAATVGVILALGLIYLLQPLNGGAVTLLLFLCVGFAELAMLAITQLFKRRSEQCPPGNSSPSS